MREYLLSSSDELYVEEQDVSGPVLSGPNAVGLTTEGILDSLNAGLLLFEATPEINLLVNSGLMRTRLTERYLRLAYLAQGGTISNGQLKGYEYPQLVERHPGQWMNFRRRDVPDIELGPLRNPYVRYTGEGGESLLSVVLRVFPLLETLRKQHGNTVIVCHEMVCKAYLWSTFDFDGNPLDKDDPRYQIVRGNFLTFER